MPTLIFRFFVPISKKMHWSMKAGILIFFLASIGAIRLTFIFTALQQSPMGSVHSIIMASPILVMFFEYLFLTRNLNVVRCLCGITLGGGIFMITYEARQNCGGKKQCGSEMNNSTLTDSEVSFNISHQEFILKLTKLLIMSLFFYRALFWMR